MTESARGDVLAWVGVSYPLRGNKGLVDKTWRRRRLVCGRRSNLGVTTMVSDLGPPVMVNGLPGNMATEVAEAVLRRGLRLVPFALTGPGVELQRFVVGGQTIALVKPDDASSALHDVATAYPDVICVDYTHPSSANLNADLYGSTGLSFVMGTTGGDPGAMQRAMGPDVYAVIAPNMAKQIVALQAALEILATDFPGAFEGYQLKVVESHQSGKADTSGTAKALVRSFQQMGVADFSTEDIEKIRDADQSQARMGVPANHIAGHAFHTYRLTSPDETVSFEFQHNVCGRRVYAEGTVDAVQFIHQRRRERTVQRSFNMIDVLRQNAKH